MTLALGVDTGGTYTDAVILRDEREVVATAKSLTTKHDLAQGVGGAVAAVLSAAQCDPSEIAMAALSTTLATNALVEGQGGRIGFVAIGMGPGDLEKFGVTDALRGDPQITIAGGHDHAGHEAAPLDVDAVRRWAASLDGITGFAVAGHFATRNPAHENSIADLLQTIAPVSCSHALSAKLGGPKRALTAVLNARLIGLTHGLIGRAEDALRGLGVNAPLMVVRGDGALMSAAQAKSRPIETILSGPAASTVGAAWLTGAPTALVSDIGGTTTDIALLRDGRPAIDPNGAQVGGFRTMVEAVDMRTHGLGGDSEVAMRRGLTSGVTLGPRRVVPLSLLALENPEVRTELDRQLRQPAPGEHDGCFVRQVLFDQSGLDKREAGILARLDTVKPLGAIIKNRIDLTALDRLRRRGIVQIAGLTPSDAAHILGYVSNWDIGAAQQGLELMARRRAGHGDRLADTAQTLAEMIERELHDRTIDALLETAFAEDPIGESAPSELARHALTQAGLTGHKGLLEFDTRLAVPIVGLGASAKSYYGPVGQRLKTQMRLPDHAPVANAIGAVVGGISARHEGTVTAVSDGLYRAHLASGPADFTNPDAAIAAAKQALEDAARGDAHAAGAQDIDVKTDIDLRKARIETREVFVEARIRVEARGRARFALDELTS